MISIAAGVVAYNPDGNLRSLCSALIAQGCHVHIHDNASVSGLEVLADCERAGAVVIRAAQNSGVAGGLAGLLTAATTESHDWLLTFDQDSRIEDGFVPALAGSSGTAEPRVAIVAPRVVERATSRTVQGAANGRSAVEVRRVITSGSLCRVAAVNEVGGFREDLFIDYVDYDVCLRLRAAGWRVVVEPAAVLHHSIGAQSAHRLLGLVPIETSNHSPDRQYYKYRNYVLLLRDRTLLLDPKSALLDGAALLWQPLKIALFERNRASKLRAMGRGVADGLAGRAGRRPGGRK